MRVSQWEIKWGWARLQSIGFFGKESLVNKGGSGLVR
jgi:hypothetical protein